MDSGLLTTLTHRAMATEFTVMLPGEHPAAADAVLESLEMLDEIEAQLTIYQPSSEISLVNREANERPVAVSPEVFSILQRAIHWSQQTDGAFDITAGPLVEAWGFTKRTGKKPTADEIEAAKTRVGYQHLVLDPQNQTVAFEVPGMSINLGGIGKGYALDRLTERLDQKGVQHFLLHGGQSSVVARGDQTPGSQQGWAIGISHPTKPQHRIAGIWLKDTALGTSGSGKQFFHHQGRRYGHVIDPRIGYPAGDLLALTVLTPQAIDADAAATGYFVAGSDVVASIFETDEDREQPTPASLSMLAIASGQRQDACQIQSFGAIDWVDG